MKYKVHIEETLERDVFIEADTSADACHIVNEKIADGEIILTADDFSGFRLVNAIKYGN